jgi:hypothetical protein
LNGYNPSAVHVPFGDARNKNTANRPDSVPAAGNATPKLSPQQQQEQTKIAQIQSQYANLCGCADCSGNPNQKAEDVLARVRAESYAHIAGHEQAHQAAAGSLGGAMSIEYNQDGVAVAGHVPISIPGLDKSNPEGAMTSYQKVRAAALAPSDPSGQDMSVASQAQSLMGRAKVLIDQNRQKTGVSGKNPSQPPG